MKAAALEFERPAALAARAPAEALGRERDAVRLLVSTPDGHHHSRFANLANFLEAGDLLVVNRSATLPASLAAQGEAGSFVLNLSNRYGPGLWLAEPRRSASEPGGVAPRPQQSFLVGGTGGRFLAPFPRLPRLWFVHLENEREAMRRSGSPIRYGYLEGQYPLGAYQTVFADRPGSAEMPSAARPFTSRVLTDLRARGVELARITLHTGVSSLEVETENLEDHVLYPEAFEVDAAAAQAVNAARAAGRRVIAVGTTVVKALESAWDGRAVRPARGFTRRFLHPGRPVSSVNGLISGLHDPRASHLALLYALAGEEMVRGAYREAVRERYLWHEFGDSHLLLPARSREWVL
ncbi:S-adenosylmethionine:tRNA ribosyltransferase-isomerase [Deinobacterium chartae]|uniref:S-adenosylmethionine:tRNA ribosyltransferase-isomerase n=1 Tax=Deinobacterium chartae TaxID=521158 RepID=A0A841HXE4_9DEIO|nr:S-adenosylmethionine:tRNA ribosyltransferase-isomerase [Deinobacterium chartae]